jgi:hypothetical protein
MTDHRATSSVSILAWDHSRRENDLLKVAGPFSKSLSGLSAEKSTSSMYCLAYARMIESTRPNRLRELAFPAPSVGTALREAISVASSARTLDMSRTKMSLFRKPNKTEDGSEIPVQG